MWVDITILPRTSVNPTDHFSRPSDLDPFLLGGMLCGTQYGFVRPEISHRRHLASRLLLLVDTAL